MDRDELYRLYVKDELNMREISERTGIHKSSIRRALMRYKIPIRTTKEASNTKGERKKRSTRRKEYFENDDNKEKQSEISKKLWEDENYKSQQKNRTYTQKQKKEMKDMMLKRHRQDGYTDKLKPLISAGLKKKWSEDDKFRNNITEKSTETFKNNRSDKTIYSKMIENHKKAMRDPEYRKKRSELVKEFWKRPNYKKTMIENRSKMVKISSQQIILYDILDDLKIEYYKEYNIGPYAYDCYLPKYNIIIEVQGDYWHNLPDIRTRDKQKSSYLANNFPELHLKYIWEHEFKCKNRIYDLLKYWTGKEYSTIDFKFSNILEKNISTEDCRMFLGKYHYLQSIGNNKFRFGFYLDGTLISLVIFGQITRKESAERLGYKSSEVLELTRLCIHPSYQKKNLASYMIGRCVNKLKEKAKLLISYSDTTFNHSGTIYKASNWDFDGIVQPSYWYVDEGGWVMHKKTLYNHARSLRMKEAEFANKNGYIKVHGKEKLRFIYKL